MLLELETMLETTTEVLDVSWAADDDAVCWELALVAEVHRLETIDVPNDSTLLDEAEAEANHCCEPDELSAGSALLDAAGALKVLGLVDESDCR
jgi:hypothetical protein